MRMEPVHTRAAEPFAVPKIQRNPQHEALMASLRLAIRKREPALPQLDRTHPGIRPWLLGLRDIDAHLAGHGLARTTLHDVSPESYGDMPAAAGFALALAIRRLADPAERRPLLWCRLSREEREYGRLYGHGLETMGLPRRRFLTVTLHKPVAVLWTVEEALKSGALALVISDADPRHTDLTATRRLSLAAQAGKSAGLLVFSAAHPGATSSHTRWIVAALRSKPPPHDPDAPGAPAFAVRLIRARGGRPGAWNVEWQNAPHRFSLVPGIRDRTFHPWADESQEVAAAETPALRAG
jgi:protein ImuA